MKRIFACMLVVVLLLSMFSCGKTSGDNPESSGTDDKTQTRETSQNGSVCEIPETVRFDGETFAFAVYENVNVNNLMIPVEDDGDTLSQSLVTRWSRTEDRFGIEMMQYVYPDRPERFQVPITSGLADFNVANVRCTLAISMWTEGLLTSADSLPYINTDKDYWSDSINDSISLLGKNYTLIGDMLISSYDLTYALLFNQSMVSGHSLGDLFSIVNDGDWTTEKMFSMMKAVTLDADGDGSMTEADIYGYVAHSKQVLPNFWIAAGEKSVRKDQKDLPYLAMNDERFFDVFERVFEITWDAGTYRKPVDERISDIPIDIINLFVEDHALFIDTSFFYINQMNTLTSDFGVIPYPKYDEDQKEYYSRLSYYNAPIVPYNEANPELVGAVLEYFNYLSRELIIPEYYEKILKTRSVDEASSKMLDLIFRVRVTDIGDTTLCDDIRDGFVYDLFRENDRSLISKISAGETAVADLLSKIEKMTS